MAISSRLTASLYFIIIICIAFLYETAEIIQESKYLYLLFIIYEYLCCALRAVHEKMRNTINKSKIEH